jgi:glucose-1-phosphate adenylyltransferase
MATFLDDFDTQQARRTGFRRPASCSLAAQGGILALVMAGGRGDRLRPLTEYRAKPAVPFGGMFRLVDFVLGNMVNSGIHEIGVLVQYKAQSLIRHLLQSWAAGASDYHLIPLLPSSGTGTEFYCGTADAVYQNLDLIRHHQPEHVLVFGADHVYAMDVRQMIDWHLSHQADVTVSTIPMPSDQAARFGTASVDPEWRISEFAEKTAFPKPIPWRPDLCLVSMGNYVFKTDVLCDELAADERRSESRHDFGRDILPRICSRRRVFAYDFRTNILPGRGQSSDYWRDVGTLQSFYRANLDLVDPFSRPEFLSDAWPLRPARAVEPPARRIDFLSGEFGSIKNSLMTDLALISGAWIRNSVIGPNVRVHEGAVIDEAVLLGHAVIKRGARVRRAIIDQGNVIGEGERVGYDLRQDSARFHVDDSGIIVAPFVDHPLGPDQGTLGRIVLGAPALRA